VAQERSQEVEALLAAAADRTRQARAELAAAGHDLFLAPGHRLTDQQRALTADVLVKLVAAIETELRQAVAAQVPGLGADPTTFARLEAAGLLRAPDLLQAALHRVEEHRLALLAAETAFDAAGDTRLLDALARNADAELARRAVAYVVGEARRRDRFREPLLQVDDLPAPLAYRLHWQVAAALRQQILADHVIEPAALDAALEDAVRQAMADHHEAQGAQARAVRLAIRLRELGELDDDFLVRSLAQGHLALFAGGLATRAAVAPTVIWEIIADRGRSSLLALLRAIEASSTSAAAIVELLDAGQPLARPPTAQRALVAAYASIDRADALRLLRHWQLDPGFREAIADVDGAAR
jgi:hypothetical protein